MIFVLGQINGKCSGFQIAFHTDRSVMGRHDFLGYGKAQAGTAGFAGTGIVQPVKFFKDSLLLVLRDGIAVIGKGNKDAVFFFFCLYCNDRIFIAVCGGVFSGCC